MSSTHPASESVVKVAGDPGSGKSHYIIQRLREFLNDSTLPETDRDFVDVSRSDLFDVYDPVGDQVTLITFSKTAARGLNDRLDEEYVDGDEENPLSDHFGATTFNSRALTLVTEEMGDNEDVPEIVTQDEDGEVFEQFFSERVPGVDYDADTRRALFDEGEDKVNRLPEGNKVIGAYNYISGGWKSWGWSYVASSDCPIDVDLPHSRIVEIMEKWEAYKREKEIWQHHDYMQKVRDQGLSPYTPVLIVDEFQDLNPLMYEIYKQWEATAKKTIICGDPKQSVYSFLAADPAAFRKTPGRVVRLSETRRCGENIVSVAQSILQPTSHDVQDMSVYRENGDAVAGEGRVWDAKLERGENEQFSNLVERVYDRNGSVMVLGRMNRYVRNFASALRDANIPYQGVRQGDRPEWDSPAPALFRLAQKVENGEGTSKMLPDSEIALRHALQFLDVEETGVYQELVDRKYAEPAVGPDALQEMFPGCETAVDVAERIKQDAEVEVEGRLVRISEWTRDVVRDALDAGYTHINPGEIRVGTLHSAKGLEDEAVIISSAYSRDMEHRFRTDDEEEEEERRLLYVGVTRAKTELVAVHDWHGSKKRMPVLEEGIESLI